MSKDPKSGHYDVGGIEVLEIIKAKLTPEQYEGYLLGNAIKYSCRLNWKGAKERDIEKLANYSVWLNEFQNEPREHETVYGPNTIPPLSTEQLENLLRRTQTVKYGGPEPIIAADMASGPDTFVIDEIKGDDNFAVVSGSGTIETSEEDNASARMGKTAEEVAKERPSGMYEGEDLRSRLPGEPGFAEVHND